MQLFRIFLLSGILQDTLFFLGSKLQFADAYLICHTFFCLLLRDLFHVLAALDPSPDPAAFPNPEMIRISGISAPADARDVIAFSVWTVHSQQNIRDFSSKRCFPVNRFLTDESVQKNIICLFIFRYLFNKCNLPYKNGKDQSVPVFFVTVIRPELSAYHDESSSVVL